MARCVLVLFVFLVGVAHSASAQTPPSIPPSANVQNKSSKDVPIVLEVRWLTVNDNFEERLGPGMDKLPRKGFYVVCEPRQTEWLLSAVAGDKRSNAGPPLTINAISGKKREFAPYGANRFVQGNDAVQATVSDDRQAVQLKLTWAKWKDGTEPLPVTTVTVPIGSYLFIHTQEYLAPGTLPPASFWEQIHDRLFGRKCVGVGREKQQVFLAISPRIAPPDEKQPKMAAR